MNLQTDYHRRDGSAMLGFLAALAIQAILVLGTIAYYEVWKLVRQ